MQFFKASSYTYTTFNIIYIKWQIIWNTIEKQLQNSLVLRLVLRARRNLRLSTHWDNLSFVCTHTHTLQVQSMLEDIGLGDYVTKFAKELIDGSILVQVDEQTLEHELAMKSSLHREKLLKLISGHQTLQASRDKTLV